MTNQPLSEYSPTVEEPLHSQAFSNRFPQDKGDTFSIEIGRDTVTMRSANRNYFYNTLDEVIQSGNWFVKIK